MRRKVVPKPGIVVFDPYGRRVPDDGARIVWSSFWDRRFAEGAITFTELDDKPAAKPRKKSNKTEDSEK